MSSILMDLINRKNTWGVAAQRFEQWGSNILTSFRNDPTVVATAGAIVSDLKQSASDLVTLGDSLAGPIIAAEAVAVEAAADAAFAAYFGPAAPIASKAAHDSVDRLAAGLAAFIHGKAAEFKANMATAAEPAQPLAQSTVVAEGSVAVGG